MRWWLCDVPDSGVGAPASWVGEESESDMKGLRVSQSQHATTARIGREETEMLKDVQSEPTPLDSAMAKFLQENPHLQEALEVFGVTINQYEQLLASLNFPKTMTTNVTMGPSLGY